MDGWPSPVRLGAERPADAAYHDTGWGVPVRDSRQLWETLLLEGFQAGLSWSIILHRREAFREAFQGFDSEVVARIDDAEIDRLVLNPDIICSRAKIQATVDGVRAYQAQARLSGTRIRAVAGEAVRRENRPNIPVELDTVPWRRLSRPAQAGQ